MKQQRDGWLCSMVALAVALVAFGVAPDQSLGAEEIGGPSSLLKVAVSDNGELSVRVGEVALRDVLAQVAKDVGAELEIRGDVGRVRPQTFTGLAMMEGIRRLAGRHSSVLQLVPAGDGGSAPRLRRIIVIGKSAPAGMQGRTDERSRRAAPRMVSDATSNNHAPTAVAQVSSYTTFAKLDPQAKLHAISQLAWSGGVGYDVLARIAIAEKDAKVRRDAVAMLAHGPDNVVQRTLHAALADTEPGVRLEAVRGIARQKGATTTAKLALAATHDADVLVRRTAVIALAGADSRTTRAALRRASQDPDFTVRDAAQRILARLDASRTG